MTTSANMGQGTTTTSAPGASAPGVSAPAAAAPGTGTPGAHAATTESVNPGAWMAGFNDDLKGFVGLKGFKGPSDVVEAYRNFEKLQGVPQEKLLKLPEKMYDEQGKLTTEGRQAFERMGMPKEAKEYQIELAKEFGDEKQVDFLKSVFHEAGVPKQVGEKIAKALNDHQLAQLQAMKDGMAQRFTQEVSKLEKDWGMALEQNKTIAREGARTLGINDKQIDALASVLGHAETMKLFHKLGTSVGESKFFGGKPPGGGALEPATAVAKINELKKDMDFVTRLNKGDSQANETWRNLHQQAYPGEVRVS